MASEESDFIIPDFDLAKHRKKEAPIDREPITLWIPKESKRNFDTLQGETSLAYGKYLQDVIVSATNHVWKKRGTR